MTLCGVGGVGNELAADLVETAAANGLTCALVSADPGALSSEHYRELSQVTGISVVDVSSESGHGIFSGRAVRTALGSPLEHYDLVVCLSPDIASRPETCGFLESSELAVVVTTLHPDRADLRATLELLRANWMTAAGFVLVDPTMQADAPDASYDLDEFIVGSPKASTFPVLDSDESTTSVAEPATQEFDMVTIPVTRTESATRRGNSRRRHNTDGAQS